MCACVRVCVLACVRAYLRAGVSPMCVRVCVLACVRTSVRVCTPVVRVAVFIVKRSVHPLKANGWALRCKTS